MTDSFPEIILGTYEEYLLGYKYIPKSGEIKQTFATHSHTSSVRSVCVSGNYLASGGADDRVFVYDLKQRKEHCILTHHDATVSCLAFTPGESHLLTGSADGVLAIIRVGNWQLEKLWKKGHKGSAILAIAVHSTGKLALTLGADHTLCTWNLIKGRQAYTINLNSKCRDPKSLEYATWAPCGTRFVLAGGKYTEIWSIETGGPLNVIEHPDKVTCCKFISNNSLLVGYENGKLGKVKIESGKIKTYDGHDGRVKAISVYNGYYISASSKGDISIWDTKFNKLIDCNSGCRIICLCIAASIENTNDIIKEEIPEDSEIKYDSEDIDQSVHLNNKRSKESDLETEIVVVPKKKIKSKKK